MATMTVDCGSFNKTSYNGATQYGSVVNFSIPAGATITGCSVTFTTHAASGQTNDRAFSLNGIRAHSDWPSSGMSLNASLLSPGNNTFRVTLKSRTASGSEVVSCTWNISGITLYITYNDGGGGSAPPVGGGGPVVITPSSIDAGAGSVTVTCPAEGGIWHMINWSFGSQSGQWSHPWEAGGTETINIPLSWISELPNATQGTLAIRVRRSTTPAMPYSYATDQTTNVTINVPASVVPSISDFTATLVPNGVPGTIAGYVQNKSKVALAMTAAGGSYSPITGYSITGGGISGSAATGTFGPFNQSGDVVFTAKVTDGRGRTATRQVAINIMPYTAPAFSSPEAWRSNYDGVKNQKGTYVRLKSGASFSSLEGQNAVTLKGRVYIKGGTAPAWSSMTSGQALILGGGALLFTRTYIAQIQVSDLLESRITEFIIPTKKTGLAIMAGVSGAAIGKSAETPGILDVAWPIVAPGMPPNPNLLHNWDFRNPVNQRGATGTIGETGYFYDRWIKGDDAGTVTINPTYLTVRGEIFQKIENVFKNTDLTLSVMINDVVHSVTKTTSSDGDGVGLVDLDNQWFSYFYSVTGNVTTVSLAFTEARNVQAVKLELGTVSTLEYDPPMDHAVELPKCQRYFINAGVYAGFHGNIGGTGATASLRGHLPCNMRIAPSLNLSSGDVFHSGGFVTFNNVTGLVLRGNVIELTVTISTGLTPWTVCTGQFGNAELLLSADL